MNSFDLMMERYKKELVDANRRSMQQELEQQTRAVDEQNYEEKAVQVSSQPNTERTEKEISYEANETLAVSAEPMNEEKAESASDGNTESNNNSDSADSDPKPQGSTGSLRVQVFAAQQVYPIQSARVIVRGHDLDEIIFDGYTDSSGVVDNISLPTPVKSLSGAPGFIKPYSQYDVFVTHPQFISRAYMGVPVFPGVESIQTVSMNPRQFGVEGNTVITESEPNELLMKKGEGD